MWDSLHWLPVQQLVLFSALVSVHVCSLVSVLVSVLLSVLLSILVSAPQRQVLWSVDRHLCNSLKRLQMRLFSRSWQLFAVSICVGVSACQRPAVDGLAILPRLSDSSFGRLKFNNSRTTNERKIPGATTVDTSSVRGVFVREFPVCA